jgi:enterochelin esterase family protein
MFRLPLLLGALALGSTVVAKAPDFKSPEVGTRDVTFRCYAPGAKAVSVQGLRNRKPEAMTKDASGVWSVTVSGLAPDIYAYSFDVDGATVLDARNRSFKRWITTESAFEFTAGTKPLWSTQAVSHGVVHRHVFTSEAAAREDAFQVYTPPAYDSKKAYPVVFLFHGYGDDETAWAEAGHAAQIADNLIAAKRMVPAVIVMTHGHPVSIPTVRQDDYWSRNDAAMAQMVIEEVLPLVESHYGVSTKASKRAIVGLSMGGGHALQIGLAHPELFQSVGAFSAAAPEKDLAMLFPGLTKSAVKPLRPALLFLAIGKDDFLLKRNETLKRWLEKENVPHVWRLTEGGHEWTLWRDYLGEFLESLFR